MSGSQHEKKELSMVRWMRTASVRSGKGAKALEVGKKLAAFAGQQFGLQVQVFYDAAGAGNRIVWMADVPDMGVAETLLRTLMSNPDYLAMADDPSVSQLWIDGTSEDAFLMGW
jgi:hypothetical protein